MKLMAILDGFKLPIRFSFFIIQHLIVELLANWKDKLGVF